MNLTHFAWCDWPGGPSSCHLRALCPSLWTLLTSWVCSSSPDAHHQCIPLHCWTDVSSLDGHCHVGWGWLLYAPPLLPLPTYRSPTPLLMNSHHSLRRLAQMLPSLSLSHCSSVLPSLNLAFPFQQAEPQQAEQSHPQLVHSPPQSLLSVSKAVFCSGELYLFNNRLFESWERVRRLVHKRS